jgi:sigma-B regulation protein RsbU (phosphoserine phosphatase)
MKKAKSPRGETGNDRSFSSNLFGLFTDGVTKRDFKDMVDRDAREALRFYMREIDFEEIKLLPWYRRYPTIVWRGFAALAYRLSPVRRITFAVATALFLFSYIQLLVLRARFEGINNGLPWLLISFVLLFLVLLLELHDKLALKGDLEIAREIQFGLVPQGPFHQDAFQIYCRMRPANTVGGDYYDVIKLEANRLGLVIADVAGKGMPAALLMALLQGSLRTLITAGHRNSDLIAKLNAYLCSSIPDNSLITLFYGELDTLSGNLTYVNAGHNAPMILRENQTLERLNSNSLILGFTSTAEFPIATKRIGPGDLLLLFTDGISEAFNPNEEEYGDARIATFLSEHRNRPIDALIQDLLDDVLEHSGSARLRDDMTLMLVSHKFYVDDK